MTTNDDTTTTPADELAAEAAASAAKDRPPRKRTAAKKAGAARKPRKRTSSTAGAPTNRRRSSTSPAKPAAPAPTPKGGRPTNDARVATSIEQAVAMLALLVVLANKRDGEIIAEAAPAIAQRTTDVVRQYPRLYAFLVDAESNTPWIGLAGVLVAGVGLPIAANHGVLPGLPPMLVRVLDGLRQQAITNPTPLDDLAPPDDVEPEPAP